MTTLRERMVEVLRRMEALREGSTFLVASSGGLDSTVLVHLLHALRNDWRIGITLAHVHHGLREDADADERFVKELSNRLQLSVLTRRVDVPGEAEKGKGSIQDAARRLRYQALEEMREECGADWILTAHHADDQAETLLMRFIHGTGPAGLAGIRERNGRVVRPLLFASREELEQVAREQHISWREDSTNLEDKYRRNVIRHHVLPLVQEINPSVSRTLGNTARLFAALEEFLDRETERFQSSCLVIGEQEVSLAVQALGGYLAFQQFLLIRRGVRLVTGSDPQLSDVLAIQQLLDNTPGSRIVLSEQLTAFRDRDAITLTLEQATPVPTISVSLGQTVNLPYGCFLSEALTGQPVFSSDTSMEYIDLDRSGSSWVLRSWREGDRFHPMGMTGSKKLSDFFSERHIPMRLRKSIPILEGDRGIIWVCGMRLDDRCKVRPDSVSVARLRYQRQRNSS